MLRTIRNILISVVVMLALIVGGGIAYVKFAGGEDGAKKEPAPAQNTNTDNFALPKPKTPNPKAPEGAAIESFLTPAKAGTNTSITIKTNAGSTCTISVTYNDVPSKDSGLTPKTASSYGIASWTWTVDSAVPVGTWPVKVTCSLNKKSAVVIGNLQVTK
jgi:hypothetical protein